jgi:hypothetical protein
MLKTRQLYGGKMNLDAQQKAAVETTSRRALVEEWRVIKDFPDYAVSNMGRVKRITDSANNRKAGFILLTKPNKRTGYVQVVLTKAGVRSIKSVHILVMQAFSEIDKSLTHQVNHDDGNKGNNCFENLVWATCKENIEHAHKTRLAHGKIGAANNFTKLKDGEVWLIKKLLAHNSVQRIIAKMFRVDRATISYIKCGKTWGHVKYETG